MALYRILMTILLGLMVARQGIARLIGKAGRDQRLDASGPLPEGSAPLIWVHGASNGEMTAARPLLARLVNARIVRLLITTNSRTARDMVAGWDLPQSVVRLAPLDHPWLVAPFLRQARPAALVILENELWPERLIRAAGAGVPVLVLGGRLSERSAARWARFPGLAQRLLAGVRWLAPQDKGSRDRFLALGLPAGRIGPMMVLKALAETGAETGAAAPAPDLPFARATTLLAASTHEGEEEAILTAFAALHRKMPAARLILAPRHPRRSAAIATLVARRGFSLAIRSQSQPVTGATEVYLADTMGEMAHWYRAAGLSFVGGSLVDRGGHTPFEPAAFGSAILHGPHLANFAAPYQALDAQGGAILVRDAAGLEVAFLSLVGNSAAQAELADRARTALASFAADDPTLAFLAALDAHLPDLQPSPAAA